MKNFFRIHFLHCLSCVLFVCLLVCLYLRCTIIFFPDLILNSDLFSEEHLFLLNLFYVSESIPWLVPENWKNTLYLQTLRWLKQMGRKNKAFFLSIKFWKEWISQESKSRNWLKHKSQHCMCPYLIQKRWIRNIQTGTETSIYLL